MLKRIPIKVLARDFCAGSSSFTRNSVPFVLPTVWDCFGNPSIKSVLTCFSWFVPVVRKVEGSRGSSAEEPGCWGRLKYNINGHWLFGWISALRNVGLGWLARTDKGLLGILHPINIFHLLVTYIILEIEYYYTSILYSSIYYSSILEIIISAPAPLVAVSFSPQQMGNPMKTVTLTLKSAFIFLSIQT